MRFLVSFVALAGFIGVWYFIKKDPNPKYRNISGVIALVALVIFGIFFSEEKAQQVVMDTVTSSTTTQQITTKDTTSTVSTTVSTASESTTAIKKFNDEDFQRYASELQNDLNEVVKNLDQVYSVSGKGLVLYLTVPQDFKYDPKDEIQRFADTVLQLKNKTFPVWLVENGYSPEDVSIHLHIKVEDGTTIAKETFSGSMKVTK